ncbi:Bestrophin [Necator americanus]|uniref:Bestrophin homolog n=1 Tax=Necator americanus TaxID=51031 RepID=W2T6L5_NECAM|nr:Bestrophin [Necator americanus]ETN76781.1 Bestrophin [Necator americanus]
MTVSYSGNFMRLLLRWKGSIWRSVWIELVVFLLLYYAVRIFYLYGIPAMDENGELGYKKKFYLLCKEFNEYTKFIPLTFLLGFYVSNVVSRWWRQFECLSWPEDLLSIVCMIFHENTENSKKKRHQIARYLNLVSALAWRDISDKIRLRFPSIRNLIDAGLMTEGEFARLEKMQIEAGRVPTHYLSVFTNELKQYRTSFRKLFCHDWVCVPLVYTQDPAPGVRWMAPLHWVQQIVVTEVASLATYAFFVFCLLGRQEFDSDEEFDIVFPVFTVVQFLFYVGWFKVGQDLMRPFGLDDDDIELSYILDRNLVISFAIVNCLQSDQPRSLPFGSTYSCCFSFACDIVVTRDILAEFEPDAYWQHLEDLGSYKNPTTLKFGRIDLSRTAHKHPPKLHTYVQVRRDEKAINPDEFPDKDRQRWDAFINTF